MRRRWNQGKRQKNEWTEKQRCIGNLNVSYSCSFKAIAHGRYSTCLPRQCQEKPSLVWKKTVVYGLLCKVEGEKDVHDGVCGFPYRKHIGVVSIECDKAQNSWS